jgi:hypothetical protein
MVNDPLDESSMGIAFRQLNQKLGSMRKRVLTTVGLGHYGTAGRALLKPNV